MAVYGGLKPWGTVRHTCLYPLSASEGNDIYKGDPIAASVGGYATLWDASTNTQFLGSALAFFDSAMDPINYYPNASYAVVCYVLVADDPDQEFVMAEDSDTSQLAQTDVFVNITMATGTGDSATGLSAYLLDSSSGATTATLPLKLLRLAPIGGNTVYSATLCPNPKWIVSPVYHARKTTTGLTT